MLTCREVAIISSHKGDEKLEKEWRDIKGYEGKYKNYKIFKI